MIIKSNETICVGAWQFSPLIGTLTKENTNNRLENRASSLLEFLCQNPGQLVTHAEIIQHVWSGRFISPNSVAVVISDIRRALGDDARSPNYIETLPKRGYRMIATVTTPLSEAALKQNLTTPLVPTFRRQNFLLSLLAVFTIIVLIVFGSFRNFDDTKQITHIFVKPVLNETHDVQFTALATAVTELLTIEITQNKNLNIKPEPNAQIVVIGNLILWDGHPAIALHAVSISDGRTLWSGIASGPETQLPKQVKAKISELAEQLISE